jgi:hypothetical protein
MLKRAINWKMEALANLVLFGTIAVLGVYLFCKLIGRTQK